MPNVTILCPVHNQEETISLPDSYAASRAHDPVFEGDVPCGGGSDGSPAAMLYMKIHFPKDGGIWVENLQLK